jgi:hypothetical protein
LNPDGPIAPARRLALAREIVARSPDLLEVPLSLGFEAIDGEVLLESWRRHARAARAGQSPAEVVIYVHIPFCARVCTYCLLAAERVPGRAALDAYVDALVTQIVKRGEALEGLRASAVHIGGGTPTLLSPEQLDRILSALSDAFPRSAAFQMGVEGHPATCTPERLEVLARHGTTRLSLGVESLTESVLTRVGRGNQTEARVVAAVAAARAAGIGALNVDMLAGLPGETVESFSASLRRALRLDVDSMSINRYLAESSPLAEVGWIPTAEDDARATEMLAAADALIRAQRPPRWPREPPPRHGYGVQYVWQADDGARPYFQQDMVGPGSTLALGHGGMGHLFADHYAIAAGDAADWTRAVLDGREPGALVCPVNRRFEAAFHAASAATREGLSSGDFEATIGRSLSGTFGPDLEALETLGLLIAGDDGLRTAASSGPSFAELLLFLLLPGPSLEAACRALDEGGLEVADAQTAECLIEVDPSEPAEAIRRLEALGAASGEAVHLRPAGPLSAPVAETLLETARRRRLRVDATPADPAGARAQYARIQDALPPSLFWCRLAMRAARAARSSAGRSHVRY